MNSRIGGVFKVEWRNGMGVCLGQLPITWRHLDSETCRRRQLQTDVLLQSHSLHAGSTITNRYFSSKKLVSCRKKFLIGGGYLLPEKKLFFNDKNFYPLCLQTVKFINYLSSYFYRIVRYTKVPISVWCGKFLRVNGKQCGCHLQNVMEMS